jgi:fatty acid desaturase
VNAKSPRPEPVPTTRSYPYRLAPREVARHFAPNDGEACDLQAGAWSLLFYGSWAGLVAGLVPGPLFAVVGTAAFIRNFNALHQGFHARRRRDRAWVGRHLFVVTSPWMLGYEPLRDNHLQHHTWANQDLDPDHYLASGPWLVAVLNALTQPEQGFVRYVRRRGWSREVVGRFLLHGAAFTTIAWVGGLGPLLWWVVVTRFANTASWFIFDWCIHHPRRWGDDRAPGFPAPLRWVWIALFSRDNLYGVEYHHVHHQYPHVPDRDLARLSAALEAA